MPGLYFGEESSGEIGADVIWQLCEIWHVVLCAVVLCFLNSVHALRRLFIIITDQAGSTYLAPGILKVLLQEYFSERPRKCVMEWHCVALICYAGTGISWEIRAFSSFWTIRNNSGKMYGICYSSFHLFSGNNDKHIF